MLTKLEDQILLSVWKFQGKAYGISVYQHLERLTQSKVSMGVVYFALDRLTKRGFLESYKGEPTAVRGGMRKKYYRITQKGLDALAASKEMNDRIWSEFHGTIQEKP
jgi:DNA-binding PadR family transcriptional regulator